MKTLIFNTTKNLSSKFGTSKIVEFVKQGSINDALNYFDGSKSFGNIFYNEKLEYYYSDNDQGIENALITKKQIKEEVESTCLVDNFKFYTLKIDNLSVEELEAIINANYFYLKEILEANDYNYNDYLVAEYFNDLKGYLTEDLKYDYIDYCYEVSEIEFDNGENEFELNGKFYQKK